MPIANLYTELEAAISLRIPIEKLRELCALRRVPFTAFGPTRYFKAVEVETLRKMLVTGSR